jgi:pimeloyl-ACP methyl ester carboxylesterase
VIINHGIDPNGNSKRVRFQVAAREFVQRGYAVLIPQRRGFGGSEGPRDWADCDPSAYSRDAQKEILATIHLAKQRDDIDTSQVLVVGHSVGGLVSLKLAESDLEGIRGVINMSGGFMWPNCEWQQPLLEEMQQAGRSSIPSLWLYAKNDSLFMPELVNRMFDAYKNAGGNGRLVSLPNFSYEGHYFFLSQSGSRLWWAETERFMTKIGLSTVKIVDIPETETPRASGFAHLADISKVPFAKKQQQHGIRDYQKFLIAKGAKAFALSKDGTRWGWSQTENPLDEALEYCNNNNTSNNQCKLYAADQQVVWEP